MKRVVRGFVVWGTVGTIVLLAASAVTLRGMFAASLARTSGVVRLAGLNGEVTIERDDRGIPTIRGETFDDVALALGFVHGQERFFQMDLLRRKAAGELAEMVGAAVLYEDRGMRHYRFRAIAQQMLDDIPQRHRKQLEAYAKGVNAGLDDLGARPPEYWALRQLPEPWLPEDTLLVNFAMFDDLSIGRRFEARVNTMRAALPRELADFLTPETGRFDAPLIGGDEYEPPAIPGPEVIDLRASVRGGKSGEVGRDSVVARRSELGPVVAGSNSWAIAASKSVDGRAILASDPHLGIMVPGIWYRAQLQWREDGVERMAVGITLPGVPCIVMGSNTDIAWGMTNVTGDFQDYVIVEVDPDDSDRYLTEDGSEAFGQIIEEINVAGREVPTRLVLRTTKWGVVTSKDHEGRPLVLKWTATEPGINNLGMLDLMHARTLDEGIEIARGWFGPPQNCMFADRTGRVGFVVSGWLPDRQGYDGLGSVRWNEESVGWKGPLDEALRPFAIDPVDGFVNTANARTVGLEQARRIGRHWPQGTRQGRIAELLRADDAIDEIDMMSIQLDTRVKLLDFYRDAILEAIDVDDEDTMLRAARASAATWNGHADVDERGFSVVWAMRAELGSVLIDALTAPCKEIAPGFRYRWFQWDEWVMRLLEEKPKHLLPAEYESWQDLVRRVLRDAIDDMDEGGDRWGEHNIAQIHHPLTLAVKQLGPILNMPEDELQGHSSAVRVANPNFGASMRLVVSPGHEDEGFLHMPCGQSGHFLSKHYGDMHADWVEGKPTPLLAGPIVTSFRLMPGR